MKKITDSDPEATSADIVAGNVERLKELFPDIVVEGKVDFEVLKQNLGGAIEEREEKYGLNWHGKRRARQLALTPSTGTLRPCPEESVDWDTTQNLMIEGDNLEVLKLLQKSYAGKVKLIYIDPPYNTGKDFVYPDNFHDSIRNYQEITGQLEGGQKVSSNTESSGRFHTDWLNMMYPRLRVAWNLLAKDGAIFLSIADHEVHNLRILMNEVFGEENFVATVIWQKVYSPKNTARHFSEDHDYLLVYAKQGSIWAPRLLPRTEEMEERYSNPDNDPRGPWKSSDLSARNYYSEGTYPITCPNGRVIPGPPAGSYWRVSSSKFEEMDRDGRVWWGTTGNNVPAIKRFLTEVKAGRVPQTLWTHQEVGHTQEAKKELVAAIEFPNSDAVFDTPKPTRLVRRMLQLATSPTDPDLVLDFFAGSGTTACAVFEQNADDGGRRRTVLVQLPEPLDGSENKNLRTIADVTKARMRNVGRRLVADKGVAPGDGSPPSQPTLLTASEGIGSAQAEHAPDLGFRVFKLSSSNIREWDSKPENLDQSLLDSVEHLKTDRTEADILYELLLKLGLDLCVPVETRTIAGKQVHSVGGGVLMACLAPEVSVDDVEDLANGIIAWHKELAPAGETTCVFRDSAFADDVAKTNVSAILEQRGLTNVRSL